MNFQFQLHLSYSKKFSQNIFTVMLGAQQLYDKFQVFYVIVRRTEVIIFYKFLLYLPQRYSSLILFLIILVQMRAQAIQAVKGLFVHVQLPFMG